MENEIKRKKTRNIDMLYSLNKLKVSIYVDVLPILCVCVYVL